MVEPLRKRTKEGVLYTRRSSVEQRLEGLMDMPRDELAARCVITNPADPDYIPSECLVHLVRATKSDNSEQWFEIVHKALTRRILARLPRTPQHGMESIPGESIREAAFDHFLEKLMLDRQGYCDWLDFFEVAFDAGMKKLRFDMQRKAYRLAKRNEPIDDEVTGEMRADVEMKIGSENPFEADEFDAFYRSKLDAAIAMLPQEQKEIMEMMRQGIPIESQDPDAMSIVKALGCVEKTVRNRRDKAFLALRQALGGDGL